MSVVLSLSVVVMFIGSRIGKKDTTIAVVFLCFFVYMFRIDQNVRSCACVCGTEGLEGRLILPLNWCRLIV
jgi:hypothetical protein